MTDTPLFLLPHNPPEPTHLTDETVPRRSRTHGADMPNYSALKPTGKILAWLGNIAYAPFGSWHDRLGDWLHRRADKHYWD